MFNRIDENATIYRYTTLKQHLKIPYIVVYTSNNDKRKNLLSLSSYIIDKDGYRHLLSNYSFYKKRKDIK